MGPHRAPGARPIRGRFRVLDSRGRRGHGRAAERGVHRRSGRRRLRAERPRGCLRRPHGCALRPGRRVDHRVQRTGGPLRGGHRAGREPAPCGTDPCRGHPGGDPRRREHDPHGPQLRDGRVVRRLRLPHHLRGGDARRELVKLPRAQARRDHAGGVRARGDLLLRDPALTRGWPGLRTAPDIVVRSLPARRHAGRGPRRRRSAGPERLARSVRGSTWT